ncbi:MAG: AarF/UbiB family protein [Flavobacteriales bacterium]|nr:AarF/UbiB family protein [Flavobacteriales bacterium]
MDQQKKIASDKWQRALKLAKTGAKVGANYMKHYAKKVIQSEVSQEDLDKANAEEIYETLSELKGSVLKVAQMLAMDDYVMPEAYVKMFQQAQYQAPPLSYALVKNQIKKHLGFYPEEIFDEFSNQAKHAASIGQVHKAKKGDHFYAVKIQYPGVANSIKSDLNLAKPMATRIMGLKGKNLDKYFQEVEEKLMEEADYDHELSQALKLKERLAPLNGIVIPSYYPKMSGKRVITMDWIDGVHWDKFAAQDLSQETRNQIGQILWDFYSYQIWELKEFHADPHPGNFLVTSNNELAVLDFGCTKAIPDEYFEPFNILIKTNLDDFSDQELKKKMIEIELLFEDDTDDMSSLFIDIFREMLNKLKEPFDAKKFDFSDPKFFESLAERGKELSKMEKLRKDKKARGSRHAIYMNRTFFGLYNLLHIMKAEVKTQ